MDVKWSAKDKYAYPGQGGDFASSVPWVSARGTHSCLEEPKDGLLLVGDRRNSESENFRKLPCRLSALRALEVANAYERVCEAAAHLQ